MDNYYALIGMMMMVAAIVWFVSPRSRWKLRRLALLAALIALLLAIAYSYSKDGGQPADASPAVDQIQGPGSGSPAYSLYHSPR